MIWFRDISRVPRGDESQEYPIAGWWLTCWPADFLCCGGAGCPYEKRFGPFDSMQEACDFRDNKMVLH